MYMNLVVYSKSYKLLSNTAQQPLLTQHFTYTSYTCILNTVSNMGMI